MHRISVKHIKYGFPRSVRIYVSWTLADKGVCRMVDVHATADNIKDVLIACEIVRFTDRCDECPFKDELCFTEETFEHIVTNISAEDMEKLLILAEEAKEDEHERNKTKYEREWEAYADKWNDRRCDPDE